NPPFGAIIDYYLKSSAPGPVTLEILDPAGVVIRRYSSEERPPVVNPDTLDIPAFWRRTPEPLAATAGMHRWVWDLRPTPTADRSGQSVGDDFEGRRPAAVLPGAYTVKLTVGNKSYTQPRRVRL